MERRIKKEEQRSHTFARKMMILFFFVNQRNREKSEGKKTRIFLFYLHVNLPKQIKHVPLLKREMYKESVR
jgi:hypothetical protein